MHIAAFKEQTRSELPWICDTLDDVISDTFGKAPNGEFVIDPDGKIVRQRFWSNPTTLRNDLIELVGEVENPTSPEDTLVNFKAPITEIASNIVPRIELPGQMRPLKYRPVKSEFPFFAKLRVEATSAVFGKDRTGQMYLGLYLDPIYKVHWNNASGPVKIEINGKGIEFSETTLVGPTLEEKADVDPRQFLIDVNRNEFEKFQVTVHYTVCDDAETFCHTISQTYKLRFEGDRAGGSRPSVFMPGMFAEIEKMDANEDGKITKDEMPAGESSLYLSHIDRNLDDVIDAEEIKQFMSMFNNGRGFESPFDDGKKEKD